MKKLCRKAGICRQISHSLAQMFVATARRSLLQVKSTRLSLRRLATTSTTISSSPAAFEVPPQAQNVTVEKLSALPDSLNAIAEEGMAEESGSINALLDRFEQLAVQESLTSAKAAPITKPVYLTLSQLMYPEAGAPPVSDNVVELDPTVFSHPIRRDIIYLCVVHYRDSLRQGSANTKTRSEVRGSGRKVRPQKGSGKARLGDGQSPMLRGGGIAFGPKPRDFSTKLPRKVIEMGLRVALSAKLKEQRLGVVEHMNWKGMKTRPLVRRIGSLGWSKTLFVTGENEVPAGLKRSGNNIPTVDFTTVNDLKVYDLVHWPRVVLDAAAVDLLEARLSKKSPGVSTSS